MRTSPNGMSTFLNKLQVHYSNGKSSPMFAGEEPSTSAKKTVHLGDVANIRQIQGTTEGKFFEQLIFKRENGDEVGRIDTGDKIWPLSDVVTRLADGEKLIGFAGQYGFYGDIVGLRAVVWKPKSNHQKKNKKCLIF